MKISRDFACLAYMAFDCYLTPAAEAAGVQRATLHHHIIAGSCLPPQALGKGVGVTGQPQEAIDRALEFAQRSEATDQESYFGRLVEHHLFRERSPKESQRTKPEFHPRVLADARNKITKWWQKI